MQLFLDMDGVLADFDKRATEVLGMLPGNYEAKYGSEMFWAELDGSVAFFNTFDMMLDTPYSGRTTGPENRGKLIKHLKGSIVCMENALKHARRSLERAKGERDGHNDPRYWG